MTNIFPWGECGSVVKRQDIDGKGFNLLTFGSVGNAADWWCWTVRNIYVGCCAQLLFFPVSETHSHWRQNLCLLDSYKLILKFDQFRSGSIWNFFLILWLDLFLLIGLSFLIVLFLKVALCVLLKGWAKMFVTCDFICYRAQLPAKLLQMIKCKPKAPVNQG